MYVQDYDERLPGIRYLWPDGTSKWWFDPVYGSLLPYIKNSQVLICPSWKDGSVGQYDLGTATERASYGYNGRQLANYDGGKALSDIRFPAETVCFGDGGDGPNEHEIRPDTAAYCDTCGIGFRFVAPRHNGVANICFVDGHVKAYRQTEATKLQWTP